MHYKSQLLVSINGGGYIELFRSLDHKVTMSFEAEQDSKNPQLKITDNAGNYVDFKCIFITDQTTANDPTTLKRTSEQY